MNALPASLLLAVLPGQAPGPPQFKVVDIVFKVEDLQTTFATSR